ncbi:hypothetical protein [Desulfoplanes sp.]
MRGAGALCLALGLHLLLVGIILSGLIQLRPKTARAPVLDLAPLETEATTRPLRGRAVSRGEEDVRKDMPVRTGCGMNRVAGGHGASEDFLRSVRGKIAAIWGEAVSQGAGRAVVSLDFDVTGRVTGSRVETIEGTGGFKRFMDGFIRGLQGLKVPMAGRAGPVRVECEFLVGGSWIRNG